MQKTYALYSCCIPVKGAKKSIIYDLQRCDYTEIPNDLYDILMLDGPSTNDQLLQKYGLENVEIIGEYYAFLSDKEYGWWMIEKDDFPKLDLAWDFPGVISNAVIEISQISQVKDYGSVFNQLEQMGCQAIELIFLDFKSLDHIEYLLSLLRGSSIRSVELIISFGDSIPNKEWLKELCNRYNRITYLTVLSDSFSGEEAIRMETGSLIIFTKELSYDTIDSSNFSINIETFTEAQDHNLYFNRKLSIDTSGYIKNYFTQPKSFGHINDTPLINAIEESSFKKYWFISKDKIDICRDCEFRYMCIDPLPPVPNGKSGWKRPSPCAYDPYSASWNT